MKIRFSNQDWPVNKTKQFLRYYSPKGRGTQFELVGMDEPAILLYEFTNFVTSVIEDGNAYKSLSYGLVVAQTSHRAFVRIETERVFLKIHLR